jgi:predicted PurR-regulated permease PerM
MLLPASTEAEPPRRSRPETWLSAVSMLILRIVLAVTVGYVLFRLGFIIVVVLTAAMLALAMTPLVDWLQRSPALRPLSRPARRTFATSVVFIGLAVALGALSFVMIQPLAREIKEFVSHRVAYERVLLERAQGVQGWYNDLPDPVRQLVGENGFKDMGARAGSQLQEVAKRTLHQGMLLAELILIPVLAFSFLTESRPLKREFAMVLPRSSLRDGLYVMNQAGIILQSYAVGQVILAGIAGVVVWLLMMVMGIKYALALAVIAAVTRVIPVIGPLLGGIPIVLIATLQGWREGLLVLVVFTVMNLVESKVVMPRLIGYRIKLHPAVVIIVLLIGAEFFGMWGMFLAAPVAAVVRSVFHYFFVRPRLRGTRRPSPPEALIPEKEAEVGPPAVAGVRSHSGAH